MTVTPVADPTVGNLATPVNSGYFIKGLIKSTPRVTGFVGGTDSHDARPGSLDDGASYVAGGAQVSKGEYHLHFATGGVTFLYSDEDVLVPCELG